MSAVVKAAAAARLAALEAIVCATPAQLATSSETSFHLEAMVFGACIDGALLGRTPQ